MDQGLNSNSSDKRRLARKKYEAKMKTVNLRYNKSDYKFLESKAEFHGIAVATYVKKKSLGKTQDLVSVPAINREIKSELRRIGTNINQITRYLNSYKGSSEISPIEKNLNEHLDALKRVMHEIG
ncbi:MAG: plasmid mobilization relaxosome protein MobC [Flavobacteriales bacterium]|nr:plasmid mobilization relaxosome protein MobC [Flavobacteriales bacterium]